jgi:hypothetical protein
VTRAACVALGLLACAAARGQEAPAPEDPELLLRKLEARLLAARHVVIEAHVEAEGLVAARLAGRSELQERNCASVAYQGEYGGKSATLALRSDGRALELRSNEQSHREALGRESNRALLVGFVRMGLMHNLARLSSALAPEHGSGGIEDWIALDAFRPTTYAQGGDLQGAMSFGYDLLVAGEVVGNVRLWLDPASGLPRRRQITIVSPQGETRVVEDYTRIVAE